MGKQNPSRRIGRFPGAVIAAVLFAHAAAGQESTGARMDEEGWIRFDGGHGHIAFEVRVNDTPASAILDTGADVTMISRGLVERAGIALDRTESVRMTGIYGQQDIPVSEEFTLSFASISAPLHNVPVAPAQGFDVVLGRRLFELSVVQIDYPNQRIRFLNRDAVDFDGNVKVRRTRRGAPMVRAEVRGEKAWLLLDTGNSGACLFKRSFVRRHGLDDYEVEGAVDLGSGAVRTGASQVLQIPDFKLGPYRFETLLARYIAERNEGLDGRRRQTGSRIRVERSRYDGILGYEAMRNFVVTMDLERDRIHLFLP